MIYCTHADGMLDDISSSTKHSLYCEGEDLSL